MADHPNHAAGQVPDTRGATPRTNPDGDPSRQEMAVAATGSAATGSPTASVGLTQEQLQAIEARSAAATAWRDAQGLAQCVVWTRAQKSAWDVPALVAEVRRLRGLIQQAEWCGTVSGREACPWCWRHEIRGRGHAPTCPAFPPDELGFIHDHGQPPDGR